jgi:anti-sigma-K factor RskA
VTARDDQHGQGGDCGQDAAAYVLGALADDEAERFRRHMATCVVCRDEVSSLQAAADALPMAAPQLAARRELKRVVMSNVRADSVSPKESRGMPGTGRSRPTRTRRAIAAAATLAALGVIVGALELTSSGSSGTRFIRASVATPAASAVVRLASGHAELTVRRMPAPPAGKIYEVWLKRAGRVPTPTSALFGVTSNGVAAVGVPGNLRGVTEILVTPEPLGGSPAPTHTPVIVARLS